VSAVPVVAAGGATDRTAVQDDVVVAVRGVRKAYGPRGTSVLALQGLDLDVRRGGITCLVGASGCGKSTLLNLVAGLDRPTEGAVEVRGRTALMFQESALLPWRTVRANVELALRLRGVPRAERRDRAEDLLARVHLAGTGDLRPHQLSGGMRQRVALARALAQDADVLLMDEPFGALDAITRDLLHDELEAVCAGTDLTVLFVTHNVREAVRLGDVVHVLSSRPGRVVATEVVDLPRPRAIESREVADRAARITSLLREEIRRHA
jgi:NitT/TauT family transport system ATP-binding protein